MHVLQLQKVIIYICLLTVIFLLQNHNKHRNSELIKETLQTSELIAKRYFARGV